MQRCSEPATAHRTSRCGRHPLAATRATMQDVKCPFWDDLSMNPATHQRKDGHGMETSPTMGRAEFGRLSAAWRGEASDFTPLLNQQLDVLGEAIGVDLVSVGKAEV